MNKPEILEIPIKVQDGIYCGPCRLNTIAHTGYGAYCCYFQKYLDNVGGFLKCQECLKSVKAVKNRRYNALRGRKVCAEEGCKRMEYVKYGTGTL